MFWEDNKRSRNSLKYCVGPATCTVHIWTVSFCSSVLHLWVCGVQTVELSDCEKTQALALQVLLSLSKFNQHRIHEMDCYHGYSMIHQVLIKSKCIVGYHMLKVSDIVNSLLSSAPTTSADLRRKASPPLVFPGFCVPWIWSSPPHWCRFEPVLVTLLLLDPLAVSVIELCDVWALKWILSDLMKLSSCRVRQHPWLPLSIKGFHTVFYSTN